MALSILNLPPIRMPRLDFRPSKFVQLLFTIIIIVVILLLLLGLDRQGRLLFRRRLDLGVKRGDLHAARHAKGLDAAGGSDDAG